MSVLNRPALVLNKGFSPINTVSVKKALGMVFGEWLDHKNKLQPKAKVLDIDTWRLFSWEEWQTLKPASYDYVVRDGRGNAYKAPEIIVVTHYSRLPKNQLNFNRRNLFKRDGDRCQYCGVKPGTEELSIDHVKPRSKGGDSSFENCVACCVKCNQKKADKTLAEAGMKLIRQPMKPGLEIIGHTNHKIRSWEIFFGKQVSDVEFASRDDIISEAYWTVPLQ